MAKKSAKGASKAVSKGKSKAMTYSDISDDEIDKFHNQREKILLGESAGESGSEDSFDQEALMDLPSEEDSEVAAEYSEDDVLFDGEEEEEKEEKWGKSKKSFYNNDNDALEEEATEAKKLQKKRLSSMKMEDFTGGKKVSASKKNTGPVSLDLSDLEDEGESMDDDAEEGEDGGSSVGSGEEFSDASSEEFELNEDQIMTLSVDEKIELISKHSDEFTSLVTDFKDRLGYLESTLKPLIAQLKDLPTSEGLSFLKVKYQILTAYCTNVAFYLQLKLNGKSIQNHPVLGKLVKFRLLLEKIKPMENKLRYQVDRLLKIANGQIEDDEAEATKFRPNPDMLLRADGEASDEEDEDGLYKAPRLAAMHYPEDENAATRKQKHEQYLRKVNASNRLIHEIKTEFEDAPEEEAVDVVYGGKARTGRKAQEDRDRYEEDNYMRFTLDKKAKRSLKNQNKVVDELEDLNDFIEELGGKKAKGNKRSHQEAASIPFAAPPKKKSREPTAFPSDESDVEDDFYQKTKAAKQSKKDTRPGITRAPVKYRSDVDLKDSKSARPANFKMMKNKGLITSRSKETNNPRVRQRKKFERAEKRLGSFRAVNKSQNGKYGGEDSGIRTNIVRSTKF